MEGRRKAKMKNHKLYHLPCFRVSLLRAPAPQGPEGPSCSEGPREQAGVRPHQARPGEGPRVPSAAEEGNGGRGVG